MTIPEEYHDLFERPVVATISTILPDGSPHAVPVWVDFDGEYVLVVTRKGGRKHRNLERRPDASLTLVDPENQYRYLMLKGEATELTEDGAFEVLDRLTQRYWGIDEYPYEREEPRILVRIRPDAVRPRTLETPAEAD
jgi:PPOX class probable F420-dependent enzyme